MPQYFFDTHDGQQLIRDDKGLDLPGRQAARRAALEALPEMALDEMPDGDRQDFYVNVRDAKGQAIYTVCMNVMGRWLD